MLLKNFFFYNLYMYLIIYIELLNSQYGAKFLIFHKNSVVAMSKKHRKSFWVHFNNVFYICLLCIYIITLRITSMSVLFKFLNFFIFLCFSLVCFLPILIIDRFLHKFNIFIFYACFLFIMGFFTVKTLIDFMFFVELYGIFYYFLFIERLDSQVKQSLVRFINLLYLYLWNSFLTTTSFCAGIYFLLRDFGTLDFTELSFFIFNFSWGAYIIIFSLLIKLGLPLFHFNKIQVYKYLSTRNVILFSVLTSIFNIFIFYFLISQLFFYIVIYKLKILNYLILTINSFLFVIFRVNTIQLFLCYSTILTLNIAFILCWI